MNIIFSKRIQETKPYAFAAIDQKIASLKAQGIDVIDFGVGDPTSPPPEFVLEGLTPAAKSKQASGYPSYVGSPGFRNACSNYLQREFDVNVNPETQICSCIGSKEAVFHFPLTLIDPGDLVICPSPGYPPYANGTKFAGGEVYVAPLLEQNNFLIDLDAIDPEICDRAKIIWINYPNSPTGAMATEAWYQKLIAWAQKHNIVIAADEGCYIDIYFDEKPRSILEFGTEGIITFYSMSKRSNMTMFRSGFVAGDPKLVQAFKKVKTNIDSGTPTFIQDVSVLALEDKTHVAHMRASYKEKRDILVDAFIQKGLPVCSSPSTFYVWQKAPEGKTGLELSQALLELGIVGVPGEAISLLTAQGLNPGKDYVRLALVPTLEQVHESAKRIKQKLAI